MNVVDWLWDYLVRSVGRGALDEESFRKARREAERASKAVSIETGRLRRSYPAGMVHHVHTIGTGPLLPPGDGYAPAGYVMECAAS